MAGKITEERHKRIIAKEKTEEELDRRVFKTNKMLFWLGPGVGHHAALCKQHVFL